MTELNLTPAKRNCDGQPSLAPATCYAALLLRTVIVVVTVWLLLWGTQKLIGHVWITNDEIYWYVLGYVWAMISNRKRLAA